MPNETQAAKLHIEYNPFMQVYDFAAEGAGVKQNIAGNFWFHGASTTAETIEQAKTQFGFAGVEFEIVKH